MNNMQKTSAHFLPLLFKRRLSIRLCRGCFATMLVLGMLFALQTGHAQFGETLEVVSQANRAYAAEDFETAIALYEGLLNEGVTDAMVHFNLATIYDQSGQIGLALLNYRRAQQQTPRDSELSVRISEIQNNRLNLQVEETVIVDRLGTLVSPVMTTTEFTVVGFVLWLIWFGLGTFSVMRLNMRIALRPVLIVFSVVMLAIVVLLGCRLYIEAYRPAAVITAGRVPVLSGPDEGYLELYELSEAAELRVTHQEGAWMRIVLPDGRKGWLQRDGVAFVGG
jgi:tetratricopeptide (TPR) repeat protein